MLDPTYRPPEPEPPPREPVFNIPAGLLAVVLLLVAIHALRQVVPDGWNDALFLRLAFEPGAVTNLFDPGRMATALDTLALQGQDGLRQAEFGRYVLDAYGFQPWTPLSYGLLHASWTHVGLNVLWFLAFGAPVARRLGTTRLMLFLAAADVAGAALHTLTHLLDMQPVVGASAAVSACMGAAVRFMFQPRRPASAPISSSEAGRAAVRRPPVLPLRAMARDRRIVAFTVAWFATNLLFGLGALSLGTGGGPIAWEAHVGGFLFGVLALPAFDRGADRRVEPEAARDEEDEG